MKVKLTEKGKKVAENLEIPEQSKDAWNLVMNMDKINSPEAQEIKRKAIMILQENRFHLAQELINTIIKIAEADDKKSTEENFVVLQYANNECYTQAVSVSDAKAKHGSGFSVDLARSVWTYNE